MEILKCENLKKIYGKGDTKVFALDGISFSVKKGEFVAIVGASGSGKSTLLHILGGVDKPSSGEVFIENENIYSLSETKLAKLRRKKIGFIYQFYNLIPVLTAKENISLPILLDGKEVNEEKLNKISNVLGLEERLDHLPNQLSGGQQQRVSIARAIINNPAIVLADEPTGNLDSKNSEEIINLLKKAHKEFNQTLVLITHDEKIAKQSQRIIRIEDGKIVENTKQIETAKQPVLL